MLEIKFELWARNREIPGREISILGGGFMSVGSDYGFRVQD